jgi:hypothetical protein
MGEHVPPSLQFARASIAQPGLRGSVGVGELCPDRERMRVAFFHLASGTPQRGLITELLLPVRDEPNIYSSLCTPMMLARIGKNLAFDCG